MMPLYSLQLVSHIKNINLLKQMRIQKINVVCGILFIVSSIASTHIKFLISIVDVSKEYLNII